MSQKITRRQALAGGLGAGVVGSAGVAVAGDKKPVPGKKAAPAGGSAAELVELIEYIELERTGSSPFHYLLKVTGSVARKGYTNPVLIARSTTPDAQGNLTFYFAADPPVGGDGAVAPIAAKRHVGSRQKIRPDRLQVPAGKPRGAAERHRSRRDGDRVDDVLSQAPPRAAC